MAYAILGEFEIRHENRSLELPRGHALTLFAVLLLNANRRMTKADLMRCVWGRSDVKEDQLPKHIGTIREFLDKIGRKGDLVTHHRFGYEIQVAEEDLDLLTFERFVRQAASARSEQRTDDEVSSLWAALGMWRGPHSMPNVRTQEFRGHLEQLELRRQRAAIRLFDLEIARGRYEHLVSEASMLTEQYPMSTKLHEQLLVVLYRSGHLREATVAYERHVAMLGEEMGAAPTPALRDLHYAIVREDDEAIASVETAIAHRAGVEKRDAKTGVTAVPRQLPPDSVDFVGREDLVAEVTWLLGREQANSAPVVVITGQGGIGKSSFALRTAHLLASRYPHGQLFARLSDARGRPMDTGEIVAQFLRAFEVIAVPESTAERISTFRTLLSDRRVLLVLDDAHSGAQIRDLIPAGSGCGVLVTSRRRLPDVPGAHHVAPLSPLSPAQATELFLTIVRSAGITLRNETTAVDQVVSLCGGLPLALRIAAALRVHDHPRPTSELVRRLSEQGPDAFAYGELNLARTIGAGVNQLDEDSRRLFFGLGLLPLPTFGHWTAAALQDHLGADPGAALSRLAASAMVDVMEVEVRYRFHDLTRSYAFERGMVEHPNENARRAQLIAVYAALLTLVRRAHMSLYDGDFEVVHSAVTAWEAPSQVLSEIDQAPLDWFEKERMNIRAAVQHCAELGLSDLCWDLAVSAHEFYTVRSYFDDWYTTHVTALRACRIAGDSRGEGAVLACLGQPALVASRRADGVSDVAELRRAVHLLTECGDRHGQAIALRTLANALRRHGRLTEASAAFSEALEHYEASGDTVGRWQSLRYLGQTHLDRAEYAKALGVLLEAEDIALIIGKSRLIAQTRYWTGQAHLTLGSVAEARAAFNSMLAEDGDTTGLARGYALHGLGVVALREGDTKRSQTLLEEAAGIARSEADGILEGRVCLSTAELFAEQGVPKRQIAELELAAARFAECRATHLQAAALNAMARALDQDEDAVRRISARIDALYAEADLPAEDRITG
ncbi:DNA-binding transcriptional activator of the SARP family [Lentzea fradiae]|uniref:DNA-binding transcriptional activator of the SARP family n=1 Tax=Lentzea fradiae TaxID=200378 RepID=A0A1G8D6T2_9PSEU|nr:BTAD domain-containing putative transcriptional regulator [Lentzea fradiae]SDH52980.1 DNA-binding transcriptional activator of the SARP family [Lentzea fradiae]